MKNEEWELAFLFFSEKRKVKSEEWKIALTHCGGFWLSFFLLIFLPGDADNTVAGRLQLVELIQHRNKKRTDGTWVDISVACHKLLAYSNDKTAL